MAYRDDDEYFDEVNKAISEKYLSRKREKSIADNSNVNNSSEYMENGDNLNPDYNGRKYYSKKYSKYNKAPLSQDNRKIKNSVNRNRYYHEDYDYSDLEDDNYRDKGNEKSNLHKERSLSRRQRVRLEKEREKRKRQLIKKAKRIRRIKKLVLSLTFILFMSLGVLYFFFFTETGQNLIIKSASKFAVKKMNTDYSVKFTRPTEIPAGWVYDDNVINVLLVGIERNDGAANTDSMILVSENIETGEITMVSLLRDTYVEIAGQGIYRKLNYAYSHGDGIQTLIDTIQNTYRIFINAYATVNYEDFEEIIDNLGGVSIELGETEADYLNNTNYISNPDYRNVTPGWNKLNGNQALGYCRVRKVVTLEGVNDDYGRTLRQRKVINAIFEEYKDQNLKNMIKTTNLVLGSVTTNLSSDNLYGLLSAYNKHRTNELKSMMIPADGLFEPADVDGVGNVLSMEGYEEENIKILHNSLYGELIENTEE